MHRQGESESLGQQSGSPLQGRTGPRSCARRRRAGRSAADAARRPCSCWPASAGGRPLNCGPPAPTGPARAKARRGSVAPRRPIACAAPALAWRREVSAGDARNWAWKCQLKIELSLLLSFSNEITRANFWPSPEGLGRCMSSGELPFAQRQQKT